MIAQLGFGVGRILLVMRWEGGQSFNLVGASS